MGKQLITAESETPQPKKRAKKTPSAPSQQPTGSSKRAKRSLKTDNEQNADGEHGDSQVTSSAPAAKRRKNKKEQDPTPTQQGQPAAPAPAVPTQEAVMDEKDLAVIQGSQKKIEASEARSKKATTGLNKLAEANILDVPLPDLSTFHRKTLANNLCQSLFFETHAVCCSRDLSSRPATQELHRQASCRNQCWHDWCDFVL